jgi:glycosyltransferase involved in cell wall biosynthesis
MARILFVCYGVYDQEVRMKRHAEELARRGDQVDVICLSRGNNGPPAAGISVTQLGFPRYRGPNRRSYVWSYTRFFTMAAREALRLSREHRYDLAIACTMPDSNVLSVLPAKFFGTKVLLDVHDPMPELYRDRFGSSIVTKAAERVLTLQERASAWFADRVLAVHELHRQRLIRSGIPAYKVGVVMNAADPEVFRAPPDVRRVPGAFTLVCHGVLTRRMGLDTAIEAVGMVRRKFPDVRIKIIGDGDYVDEAKRLAAELKLGESAAFFGAVSVKKLPSLLADADVGLVPYHASSAMHLMLPHKLLDYTALGIPSIAARLRTIEHYFAPHAARLFEPDDAADLAAAIEELHENPALRARLALNAREVVERIGWSVQRKELCRTVDALIARSHRPSSSQVTAIDQEGNS